MRISAFLAPLIYRRYPPIRPESQRNVAITASGFATFCKAFGRTFCAGTVSDITVHVMSNSAKSFAVVRTGLWSGDLTLTFAPLIGGPLWPPLWFFLNSKKTAARSAAKFSVPSRASIWHLHTKFQVLGHLRSGAIEAKLRSCSSKNEQKSCNRQTLTKARIFKQFQSCLCNLVG